MAVIDVKAEVLQDRSSGKVREDNKLADILLAIPRLILLAIRLMFDSRVSAATKAALAGGMLYIASPIDFVPDMIPVLGQLEDMALAVLLVDGMVNHVDKGIVARHWGGKASTLQGIGRMTGRITKILPAFIRRRAMRKTFSSRFQPGSKAQTKH